MKSYSRSRESAGIYRVMDGGRVGRYAPSGKIPSESCGLPRTSEAATSEGVPPPPIFIISYGNYSHSALRAQRINTQTSLFI